MKNKIFFILIFFVMNVESFGQISIDSIQAIFPTGNIVSFKDNIATYRLKGIKNGGMYGFCKYDPAYIPDITCTWTSWDINKGEESKILNSQCYTFIAPIFDYALAFNEGWAPVCKNKKWSYVSIDGQYLCDFKLDAAYPFKDGKAKIIYEGNYYIISSNGDGLPYTIRKNTTDLSLDLRANTIAQLCAEAQYEKATKEGFKASSEITTFQNNKMPELSANALTSAIRIVFRSMEAQNNMMSNNCFKNRYIFNKYRALPIDRFISFESRHPAINRYNAEPYISSFTEKYYKECNEIIVEINRNDYKSAIVKFEKWIKDNNISLKNDFKLLRLYYYLAELSDDFETANCLLIDISSYFENNKEMSDINDEALCVMLADIKKYQSAEHLFNEQIKKVKGDNSDKRLFCLYYNLGLMYKSAKDYNRSIEYLTRALQYKLPLNMEGSRIECISELLNSQLKSNIVDEKLLKEYVDCEIEYCRNLFETENTIVLNRLWGKCIHRMHRVLCFLDSCSNIQYLKSALALTSFQQGITFDSERYIAKAISTSDNAENRNLYSHFLERKSNFRGINVFDLINAEDSIRKNIYELYELERDIKNYLRKSKGHYIPIDAYKNHNICNLNFVNIIQYRDTSNLYRYGAFVNNKNRALYYTSLSICDEFTPNDFWNNINLSKHFKHQEDIYVYYGALDTLGLEFLNVNSRTPFCDNKLHRTLSLANIITNINAKYNKNATLYGGLDYGDNIASINRGASKGFLEHSKVEIDEIAEILGNSGIEVQIKSDYGGTIESFQNLSGTSPKILHFATHGYHSPSNSYYNLTKDRFNYYRQNTDVQQQEWLMNNTGLLMSVDNNDENVLTSNKVASTDLSNTELVVLSACSTISGNSSDGIMQSVGLTTAFSLASAKNIITSLRDVDDQKTCEFMVSFYKFLNESNNIYDSFRKTVIAMKEKYPQNPQYWNSFVLVEN